MIFLHFLQKVLVQCQREIFHRPFGTVIMCRRYQRTHRWVLLTFKYSWICKKCCIFIGHRSLICIQQMAATQQIHGFRMPQLPIMAVMRMRPTLLMLTTITWHNMEVYCDYHNSTDIVRGNFFISCEFCGWQQQKKLNVTSSVLQFHESTTSRPTKCCSCLWSECCCVL